MKISKRILELELARRCWNAEDLAKAAGVKSSVVEQVLNGGELTTKEVGLLAKALKIDLEEFTNTLLDNF